MVGPLMPWVDPERLGAFSLAPYGWGFAVLVIPNLLFSGALLALLAVTTRSVLVVYLGVIGFFILNSVAGVLTADLDNVWLATLIDPLGMTALDRTTRYWSADQHNRELPELAGYLLANRALWLSVSVGLVVVVMFGLLCRCGRCDRRGVGRGSSLYESAASMFLVTTSRVRRSSVVGLNSTTSVPRVSTGVWPGAT